MSTKSKLLAMTENLQLPEDDASNCGRPRSTSGAELTARRALARRSSNPNFHPWRLARHRELGPARCCSFAARCSR
jgi:hypothetical protein